ncbi:F-actin-monooxygenase MICAL3 isoform X2 [Phlebotomus papatasi]|uniref:F-actin-monooxygenase MICAL3 isoform X2 n=1 Tax=Phlebotomus papatasi TaxID=29031 RepID=UPI0024838460|nr:F-actin-monooxygenase MICAL3 isoform X2 [Phlebotomus papatasi]
MATTKNDHPTNGIDKSVKKCKKCEKDVFHMELLKAEKSFWHRNCFKCFECNKQLRMDTYQSHEGILYCKPHFRALFAPKPVKEVTDNAPPKKYEVIVRENQPAELPPDVVRSSDKPNLGLEELQTINLRQKYQMFEQGKVFKRREEPEEEEESSEEEGGGGNMSQRLGYKEMRDIRKKFEDGHLSREERREERKQEIQNIRSRLFMGKQARIKEMYQQAVLESESGTNLATPKDVPVCQEAKNIRERFEKGEAFAKSNQVSKEEDVSELVEHGLAKKSRSIFKELDATKGITPSAARRPSAELHRSPSSVNAANQPQGEIVRSDSQVDNVQVETSQISSRFRFFETYRPQEPEKRQFRITPPREGVVRMPSPEKPEYADWPKAPEVLEETESKATAKRMLSLFRQMELMQDDEVIGDGLKGPKEFTPPPSATNGASEAEENAKRAAKARELKSKFENWDFDGVQRTSSSARIMEDMEESQVESTKSLSAKFESMRETSAFRPRQNIKVNRFV